MGAAVLDLGALLLGQVSGSLAKGLGSQDPKPGYVHLGTWDLKPQRPGANAWALRPWDMGQTMRAWAADTLRAEAGG